MKAQLLFFVLYSMFGYTAFACGNEYEDETYTHTDIEGKTKELDYNNWTAYYFNHGFNNHDLNSQRYLLEEKVKKTGSYKSKSDLALVLLKLGEKKKSLDILQALIRKYPNEYNIVANLGTAYELNGMNDSALYYIKRGVQINPASHNGSEWIHVKILEAKLKMEKDPDWLKHNSILGLDFKSKVLSGEKPDEKELKKLITIKRQLAWQLTERIAFVAPPDPVVSDLLFDLANLVALTDYLEHSQYVYNQSIDYSPASVSKVMEVRDSVNTTISNAKLKKNIFKGVCAVLIITAIIVAIRKIRKRRKAQRALKNNHGQLTQVAYEK